MNKHRKILGWMFSTACLLLLLMLALSWQHTAAINLPGQFQPHFGWILVVALIYGAAGLSLLMNSRYSFWICLPFSIISLFSFPFGTATGGYYLWYFWKFVHKRG